MPRPRWPYLQKHTTRHNNIAWYVRLPGKPLVRLRGEPGSPDFKEAYDAAIREEPARKGQKARSGTIQWLWETYCQTDAWTHLSRATRRQRENIMEGVLRTTAKVPFKAFHKPDIVASRDKRSATPAQARNFLDTMRGLFRWALEAGHIKIDPTAGVKNPARRLGGGFPVWTEADVARFQARWPLGTKERVWLDMLLYTGFRRGDVVRAGPQHVIDGCIVIQTEKSQEQVTVTIPVLPILQTTLDAGPIGSETFVCGETGKPLTKETFGNYFKAACKKAGLDKAAHGVRKIGATRAAENGATVAELEAIFGWRGGGMASLYTRAADKARLSKGAIGKLVRL